MRVLTLFLLLGAGLLEAATFVVKGPNAGRNWTDIDPSGPDRFLWWLQIDSHDSTLYAITQRDLGDEWHLLVSEDGGQTWQIRQSFPREVYRISAVAAPGAPDTLYLAYEVYGYPRTTVMIAQVTNHGASMEIYRAEGLVVIKGGNSYGVLATVSADPRAPAKLYALVTKDPGNDEIFALFHALWVSLDGGRNWERLDPPLDSGCTYPEVQIDSSDSSLYLVCGNELLKSTDGGASWTPKPFPGGERLWDLQTGPGNPVFLYGSRSSSRRSTTRLFLPLGVRSDPRPRFFGLE
ncbi:MAG TPA: sialidase family protein [Bryobacteraceae bacterium]|nr:sialidase family protein [Bryobacteraceae bacterium]